MSEQRKTNELPFDLTEEELEEVNGGYVPGRGEKWTVSFSIKYCIRNGVPYGATHCSNYQTAMETKLICDNCRFTK